MRYLLDTNVIHALLNKEDVHHEKAAAWVSERDPFDELIIPAIVIAELLIGTDDSVSTVKFCQKICPDWPDISMFELGFLGSIPISKRRSFKVVDCLILAFVNTLQAKLVTYDQRLLKFAQEIARS